MEKERSHAWKVFMREYFEQDPYMRWHDGPAEGILKDLVGDERSEAEDLLIKSMLEGDEYAAEGLAELKSTKALPFLKKKCKESAYSVRLKTAYAIELIEGKGEYIPVIIDLMQDMRSEGIRLWSAHYLRDFPTEQVINALYEAILDPKELVRVNAFESLLCIHGMKGYASDHNKIFKLIMYDQEEKKDINMKEEYSKAVELMKELFKDKRIV
ncbi:MAG: HEAT repeat domain-containing protein [Candidatus Hodarchaeota archaeon]